MKDASPPSFTAVRPFLASLIQSGKFGEAWTVWQDLIRTGVVRRPPIGNPANLVFNGDFEQAPLNGGFDWMYREQPYLGVDVQSSGAPDGGRCLRLDFTVSHNEDYEPVQEFIPVVPRQTYTLTAYVRAEGDNFRQRSPLARAGCSVSPLPGGFHGVGCGYQGLESGKRDVHHGERDPVRAVVGVAAARPRIPDGNNWPLLVGQDCAFACQ